MSNLRRTALALLGLGVTGILMGGCPAARHPLSGGDPPPIIVADGSIKLTAQSNGSWKDDNSGHYVDPKLGAGDGSSMFNVAIDATTGVCFNVTNSNGTYSFDASKITLIGQGDDDTDKYDVRIDKNQGVIVDQGSHGHKANGQQVDLGTDPKTWALVGLTGPGKISCSFGSNPSITLTPK